MITFESMMSIEKDRLHEAAGSLSGEDLAQLAEWLSLKEDNLRYQAFLLLQHRASQSADVFPFWDAFRSKLKSDNSYQRSIGAMLIAENAKWDSCGRTEETLSDFLAQLNDEKPITVRQTIQSLGKIAAAKPELGGIISEALMKIDITALRETMRKPILLDILYVLLEIRKTEKSGDIEGYILGALSGEILDKKAKKQIEAIL